MKTIEESIQLVKDFDFMNATQQEIENILPTFGMKVGRNLYYHE